MNKKIEQAYEELAHSLGFSVDIQGTALYGKRGDYDLLVYPQNHNYPYMLSVSVSVSGQTDLLTKEVCKQFKKDNKPVSGLSHSGSIVTMTLKNNARQAELQEALRSSMDALIALLRTKGLRNACQICGNPNPAPCYISGGYMHLCSDCYSRQQHDISLGANSKKNKRENVFGGIVGALLGSLIGVAAIVIISQMGYVAVISGLIMAICTLKGYEMLGGKLTKKGVVISSILMILMTAFGDRLDWALIISRELEVDLLTGFLAFPELLDLGAIEMGDYVRSLLMQYLYVLVGAIPTVITTVKNQKDAAKVYRLGGVPSDELQQM